MPVVNLNLINSLKLLFLIGKLFGSITFSIKNQYGTVTRLTTKFDKTLIIIKITSILYAFMFYVINIGLPVVELDTVIFKIIITNFILTISLCAYHSVRKQNILYKLIMDLERNCRAFNNREFNKIRKLSKHLYLAHGVCTLIFLVCNLCYSSRYHTAYFTVAHMVVISLECEMILLLYVLKLLTKNLNSKFFANATSEYSFKKYIEEHFKLFECCKKINDIFGLLVLIRCSIIFFAGSITGYNFAKKSNSDFEIVYIPIIIDIINWNIYNLLSVVLIVHFSDSTKREV